MSDQVCFTATYLTVEGNLSTVNHTSFLNELSDAVAHVIGIHAAKFNLVSGEISLELEMVRTPDNPENTMDVETRFTESYNATKNYGVVRHNTNKLREEPTSE